ncbi:isoleucine--tRNA ligase, partial [Rickettsia endosymbiont of Cardiosporidium cionae]|uniref:isoleucine--tRNA ligase n=1 Tax=Rickettsia endosymbiont of Cardiosporidium cionae TaxID=2777155 RepID=UPI001893322D
MKEEELYPAVNNDPDFPALENKILEYWKHNNIFTKSVLQRDYLKDNKNNEFIFYDGPPFANGLPHYGHLLTGFIKDTYARYKTMQGKKVERRFGWDCHGLPAELYSEKQLGLSGRKEIIKFGIEKFNAYCQESVMKYTKEWQKYVERQARWVDFKNSYKTMDKDFMESVIWAFKTLYDKGLVYQEMKVMPYSWACETPLSNFETKIDNAYRSRADKAITISFILSDKPKNAPVNCKEYRILAWTTTPWTLPSNLALAVSNNIIYACVIMDDICYITSQSSLQHSYKDVLNIHNTNISDYHTITGADLEGLQYKPLFNYFHNHKNSFKILLSDFVVENEGTGIVHIAPGFGEEDQILCQKYGIDIVCPVDNTGKFTKEVIDFEGKLVFDTNDLIISQLKKQKNWIKTEQYIHNYPHCWRTDTPLIYKAVSSFYVKVTAIKDRMVELNKNINWIPHNIKDGLFGKWIENAKDWAISRNRFWGTPIPIWISDNPNYPRIDVYGSIAELEKDFNVKIDNLHRPFLDKLIRKNPNDPTGKSLMKRVNDVFDCWFESGSMPYGQAHYPFENKQWLESHLPADFIVEYSAQTRGWFYTLMVLSTALFDKPPFLNCICHGVILDTEGRKLSKRLNNYLDPMVLFSKYGADALRSTMLSSNVTKGEELLIDKDGKMLYEKLRLIIKPMWHAYHFFVIYSNIDKIKAQFCEDISSLNVLDQYILYKLAIAVNKIEECLDNFDTQNAYKALSNFIEILNNWYIRRSRSRFWQSDMDQDKINAYNCLYTSLITISKASASLLPMITELIFLGLNQIDINTNQLLNHDISVHLTNFPILKNIVIDYKIVNDMDQILDLCNVVLSIRNDHNIRIRQPLNSIKIIAENYEIFKNFEYLIKDELNIKSIEYSKDFIKYSNHKLSINFAKLGKRVPNKIKDIIKDSKINNWKIQNDNIIISDTILYPEEFRLLLTAKTDNIKNSKALSNNQSLVILDTKITTELKNEGIARDIIRSIQQIRKEAKLNITDKIYLQINTDSNNLYNIISGYKNFIEKQTLSSFKDNIIAESTSHATFDNIYTEFIIEKIKNT